MPIGVPKVLCRWRGKNIYREVHEKLQMDRILFLYKDLEEEYVDRLISLLLFLDSQDRVDNDILFYINCDGGEAMLALTLYDTLGFLLADVCTLATGLAVLGASLILAGGTISKRVAFPNALIMISQPVTDYVIRGSAKEIQVEAEQMVELRKTFAEIYAQQTGQAIDVVQNDLERDTFMSAEEALDYRIVDRIPKKKEIAKKKKI